MIQHTDSHSESYAKVLGRKTPILPLGDNFESENKINLAENWPESLNPDVPEGSATIEKAQNGLFPYAVLSRIFCHLYQKES